MLEPVLRGSLEQVGGSSPLFTQMGGALQVSGSEEMACLSPIFVWMPTRHISVLNMPYFPTNL